MKISDVWAQYQEYTRDLTANARRLGYAAAAIAWLFKGPDATFPPKVLIGLGWVVTFFLFDVLQAFAAAVFYRFWARSQEKRKWQESGEKDVDDECHKPAWLDYPAWTFWLLKIVSLLLGYLFLVIHILSRMITA